MVNELMCDVNDRKWWYNHQQCRDVTFYPVDTTQILACPATHASNFLDGLKLGTMELQVSSMPQDIWLQSVDENQYCYEL